MDQTKHHNNNPFFMNIQFLKRVTTKLVLLSLSLLFFSHHSYELHFFSSFTTKLITHTLNKNYIFLLCNFLVLLAKYSGFVTPSKHDNNNYYNYEYYTYKTLQEHEVVQHHQMQLEKEEKEEEHDEVVQHHEDGQIEQVITIDEDDEECEFDHHNHDHQDEEVEEEEEEEEGFNEEEVGWRFWEEIEEEEEDEERGGNGRLSTEELNKKFDDFIKKMKEELRIEAQRHLVMV